jgi:hypothetical protein
MTDEDFYNVALDVLASKDVGAADSMATALATAMTKQVAEAAARHMLGTGKTLPTTIAVAPELLAMLAPRPAEITVDLIQQEQPKRKSRTVVTRHDSKGRIVEFEQETLP